MTPIRPTTSADPSLVREHGDIADLGDAVARWRVDDAALPPALSEADLTNVVPFPGAGRKAAGRAPPPIASAPADGPAVTRAGASERARWVACLICSIAAHAALYLPFEREPDPMASIGLEAITVDIVLGADQAAGIAAQPSEAEAPTSTAAKEPDPAEPPKPEPEVAREQPSEPPAVPEEPKPVETAAVQPPAEQPPAEQPEPEAMTQAAPEEPPPPAAEPQRMAALPLPDEPPPPAPELEPRLEPPPPEVLREPPPQPAAPPDPPKEAAKPAPRKPEQKREPPRPQAAKPEQPRRETRQAKLTPSGARAASSASSGVGRGSSSANSNYRGLIAAHLARFKQFPADARASGEQGSAAVTFRLDGGGRVTSVSLSRGAGSASLDREAVAMVRRASPFPAPPDGRGLSFTAPVSFRLQ
jgi:protein TonB